MSENDNRRRCWYCVTGLLIWGGDHDCEEEDDHLIRTNLSCESCGAYYEIWWGTKSEEPDG